MKLKNMSVDDANAFIQALFNSTKPQNYILLPVNNPTKAITFKITEQKLLNQEKYKKFNNMIISYANKLKNNTLNTNLIKKLEKLYEAQIKLYMKI
jgi:predicted acetyltransferase